MQVTINFRKKGVWSNNFDSCQGCKTKEKKHFAKGLCRPCYFRAYRDAVKIKNEINQKSEKEMIHGD